MTKKKKHTFHMHTQYFILTHTHILSHTAKLSPSLPPCRLISPFSPFRIWQQNGEKYTRILPNGATPRIPLCKTDESLGPGRIVICRRRKWWAVVKNEFCNKLLSALTDTEYHLKGSVMVCLPDRHCYQHYYTICWHTVYHMCLNISWNNSIS